PRPVTGEDVSQLQEWLQSKGFKRVGKETVYQAVQLLAQKDAFHLVRDYLDALKWGCRFLIHLAQGEGTIMGPNFERNNVDSYKRERRYLEPDERGAVLAAARQGRWAERDYALVLLAYRHGLRCSEIIGLQWEDVKLLAARLFVQRAKDGRNARHPLQL